MDWLRQAVERARQLNEPAQLAMALAGYVVPLANAGQCEEALRVEKELKSLAPKVERRLRDADRVLLHTALAYPEEACELDSAASLRSMEKAYQYAQKIPNDSLETDYPARLFKGVLAANYVSSLRDGQRVAEARRVLAEALQLIDQEPDAGPVRLALLRLRSTIEAEEGDDAASAATLKELLPLASESLSPMEIVRLHSVLAVRLASAGLSEQALAEIQEAARQTEERRAELGPAAHIPYIDTAVAAALIGDWSLCLEHAGRAGKIAGGQIAASQRVNYDSARGICLLQSGNVAEGLPLVRGVIESQKVSENPDRPLGKALRAAERAGANPPAP
jgi:tetratricopeptide (TPR) repeat protein